MMLNVTLPRLFAILLLATWAIDATASSSLNLVAVSHLLHPNLTETTCVGSPWCPLYNLPTNHINTYLQDWIQYSMADSDIYGPGVQIACAALTIPFFPFGPMAYCAYTGGTNLPVAGFRGSLIKQKIEELRKHGCFACGYTAIAPSGNSSEQGVFGIDYFPEDRVRCGRPGVVVCPPTTPGSDRPGLKKGPRPALISFNATVDDGAISLQALRLQESSIEGSGPQRIWICFAINRQVSRSVETRMSTDGGRP